MRLLALLLTGCATTPSCPSVTRHLEPACIPDAYEGRGVEVRAEEQLPPEPDAGVVEMLRALDDDGAGAISN